MAKYRYTLPQLSSDLFLTDGGIETTLIFLEGFDLPYLAVFDLLKRTEGRDALDKDFRTHASIAVTTESVSFWKVQHGARAPIGVRSWITRTTHLRTPTVRRLRCCATFETNSKTTRPRWSSADASDREAMDTIRPHTLRNRISSRRAVGHEDPRHQSKRVNVEQRRVGRSRRVDSEDPTQLSAHYAKLRDRFQHINVLGRCCGTDHRHIEEIGKACLRTDGCCQGESFASHLQGELRSNRRAQHR